MKWTYLNNKFVPQDQVSISPFDRGFLFGDSIYEVIPVYDKTPFLLNEHLERLFNNLDKVFIENSIEKNEFIDVINELINRNGWNNQIVYIQVSRGLEYTRRHRPSINTAPTIFIYSSELSLNPYRNKSYGEGLNLISHQDLRWARCDIKTTSLMPNIFSILNSNSNYDEVLLHNNKRITESTAGSVFLVIGQSIIAPNLDNKILNSITRNHIKNLLKVMGLELEERDVFLDEISQAHEVWYISSTKELQPVATIDDIEIKYDKKNLIWHSVLTEYVQSINL